MQTNMKVLVPSIEEYDSFMMPDPVFRTTDIRSPEYGFSGLEGFLFCE